jgi:hypothetical protein
MASSHLKAIRAANDALEALLTKPLSDARKLVEHALSLTKPIVEYHDTVEMKRIALGQCPFCGSADIERDDGGNVDGDEFDGQENCPSCDSQYMTYYELAAYGE